MIKTNDKDTNNTEEEKMISQYDIEIILDEIIAFINGKYKITNVFSIYKDRTSIKVMKPKFHFYKFNDKEVIQFNALWELKIGYYKIRREI